MQLNVREVWLFLSIFSAYSVTKNYGRHTHHSSKFANKETSTPGRQTTFSTESPDSTVLTEELDDLFNWLDDPESQPETSFTPPVTSEQLPQSNSFDAIGNDPTGSQTDVGNDTVEGTPVNQNNPSIEPTSEDVETINELLQVLQNITKTSEMPAEEEQTNGTDTLYNVTTVSDLLNNMQDLNIVRLQDLENITSLANDSLIQNLLNVAERVNITTAEELRNLTTSVDVDDIGELIDGLRNISTGSNVTSGIETESVTLENGHLKNSTEFGIVEGDASQFLVGDNITGNVSTSSEDEVVTEASPGSNETDSSLVGITEGEQPLMIPNTTTEFSRLPLVIPNTTTEFSRLETVTNDVFWPPLTTMNPTTNEDTVTSSTTGQPLSPEIKPEEDNSKHNVSEPIAEAHDWNNPYFGGLVAALVFGCLFVVILAVFIGKRSYEGYQRRHYTKMDYLVNGMYN